MKVKKKEMRVRNKGKVRAGEEGQGENLKSLKWKRRKGGRKPESAVIDETCCGYRKVPVFFVGGLKVCLLFHQEYGLVSICINNTDSTELKKYKQKNPKTIQVFI